MRIKIKEETDSHGSYIEHILDMKEGLDRIEFNALKKEVVVTYTTVTAVTKIKLNDRLDYVKLENYSI